ncbi:MAG TPA: N-acyl homoserine lactonase family protein [Solirubrobacteraceae bacterium]|jgi:glyoxylase-like metal-dependent hydrolase (beta-lactamase superfamily II)|nr:N-acyl homoserine lactonase family protein [Solirubrobacteraceae bacterium]
MSAGWTVTALRYASRMTTRSDVFLRYAQYGEPDGPQEMAYYLWVLRNGERTIVVDTGFSAAAGGSRRREFLVAPLAALARAGVMPDAVDTVINTHLHYDHAGHLDAFGDAEVLVNRTEFEFWTGVYAGRTQFGAHIEPAEIGALAARLEAGAVTLMDRETEVTPGVVVAEVGGHSPGQSVVFIEGEQGPIALASDAVHFYEELDRDRPCAILVDLELVYRGYDIIRTWIRGGGRLVAGHDPLVMDRFPRLEADPELGVLVA